MKNNFAESVFNYFQNKLKETGKSLSEAEAQLLKRAETEMNLYPISVLSEEDIEKLGFEITEKDRKKLPHMADKLGEWYCEQLFWDNLDQLTCLAGLKKKKGYQGMMHDYFQALKQGERIDYIMVVVQHKGAKIPITEYIFLGEEGEQDMECILTGISIHNLEPYFDENNQYGFYIKEYIGFE